MASVVTVGAQDYPAAASFRQGQREVVADSNGALPPGVHQACLNRSRLHLTVTAGTASTVTPAAVAAGGQASAAFYPEGGILAVTASTNPTSTTTIQVPIAADWTYHHSAVPPGSGFSFYVHNLTGSSIIVLGVTVTTNKAGHFVVFRENDGTTWNYAGVAMA